MVASKPGAPLRVGLLGYGLDRPGSGIARYTAELAAHLRAADAGVEPVLLAAGSAPGGIDQETARVAIPGLGRLPTVMAVGPVSLAAAARRHRLDLIHDPTGISPFFVPRRFGPFARVVTIHDMVPFVHPETHAPLTNALFRRYIPRTLGGVDRIVTVSEASRRDILRFYGVCPQHVLVIPNGVSARFRRPPAAEIAEVLARFGLRQPYVLAVGALQARKNLETLFDAFARLRAAELPHRLVVVGRKLWKSEGIFQRLDTLGLAEAVELTGYVADDDLPALYAGAACFVFPSLYEGFGLPPLEAMACGTPVVASASSAMPEVVGDAGVLVPPTDAAAFAAAIRRIVDDPGWAAALRERGLARAAAYTWEATAAAHAALYRELVPAA